MGMTAAALGPGCTPCVANTYKDAKGRDMCTPCQNGTYTAEGETGAVGIEACLGKI